MLLVAAASTPLILGSEVTLLHCELGLQGGKVPTEGRVWREVSEQALKPGPGVSPSPVSRM